MALSEVWPDVVHQLCQMHFLGNLSDPLQKDDLVLKQQLQQDLKGLPRVPDLSEPEAAERLSSWPVVPDEPLKQRRFSPKIGICKLTPNERRASEPSSLSAVFAALQPGRRRT